MQHRSAHRPSCVRCHEKPSDHRRSCQRQEKSCSLPIKIWLWLSTKTPFVGLRTILAKNKKKLVFLNTLQQPNKIGFLFNSLFNSQGPFQSTVLNLNAEIQRELSACSAHPVFSVSQSPQFSLRLTSAQWKAATPPCAGGCPPTQA